MCDGNPFIHPSIHPSIHPFIHSLKIFILKEYYMKFRVKTAGLIVAMVMALGSGVYFANEINAQGKTYKIGDHGPGGGYVFYDKGNSKGGWRYLEAAPEDQGEAEWGCFGTELGATGTAVGTGKRNTQIIVSKCGESGIAAKLCTAYRGGGKSDWFLPSRDELNLIYTKLHKAGVGGFADDIYWSSSEGTALDAWYQIFANGNQNYYFKTIPTRVRAVRAF
jgi:hypothetical protein